MVKATGFGRKKALRLRWTSVPRKNKGLSNRSTGRNGKAARSLRSSVSCSHLTKRERKKVRVRSKERDKPDAVLRNLNEKSTVT